MTVAIEKAASSPAPVASVGRRVRGSLLNSLSSFAVSAASYVVISRLVDPADYGRAAVVLAVWGLCAVPLEGTGHLLMRYGPVELAQKGSLRVSVSTRLVFALPPLVILVIVAPWVLMARGWSTLLAAATVPWLLFTVLSSVAQWSGVASQRFFALTLGNVLNRSAPVAIALVLFALGLPVRADALVLATLLGLFLGSVVSLWRLRHLVGLTRPDRPLLRAMWQYSLPSLVAMPCGAAIQNVDPLVLNHFVSHADVGRYQLAYAVISIFGMLGASLNSVLSPELVRAKTEGRHDRFDIYRLRDQPRFAILLGMAAFGAACVAAPIMRTLLPPRFAGTAELVALLTVAGGFMMGVWSLHPMVTVTDSVWPFHLSTILGSFGNVIGDVLLAPRLGATGVALANVGAWALQLMVLGLFLRRRLRARIVGMVVLLPSGALVLALLLLDHPLLRHLVGVAMLLLAAAGGFRLLRALRASRAAPPDTR